ncbi:MAG: hypothetical protein AAB627_00155, partial [Patescibacteria group bacterium]
MKKLLQNKSTAISLGLIIASVIYSFILINKEPRYPRTNTQSLATRFEYLSKNGNSSCSGTFNDSIFSMPDNDRIQGSCCSPMSLHRYGEQVEGLKNYSNIREIPDDPYDIEAGLAKNLKSYYDLELTPKEQKAYDYALANSHEKGPCCCKCWRWYVYG